MDGDRQKNLAQDALGEPFTGKKYCMCKCLSADALYLLDFILPRHYVSVILWGMWQPFWLLHPGAELVPPKLCPGNVELGTSSTTRYLLWPVRFT